MKPSRDYSQAVDPLHEVCPARVALDLVRGRWKPSILFRLRSGAARFGELESELAGVTAQALSVQLRQLEADGVVSRTVFAEVPARVEYALTEYGRELARLLDDLDALGRTYQQRREPV